MVRQRKRHLMYRFEVDSSSKCSVKSKTVLKSLIYHMKQFYGDFGAAITCQLMHIRYFSEETNTFAISVYFGVHRLIMNCFSLMKSIEDNSAVFHLLHVGGSLKSCLRYLRDRHTKEINHLLQFVKNQDTRVALENDLNRISELNSACNSK